MPAPLFAKQTNYIKENVPYYKYYTNYHVQEDSDNLFNGATATVGGQQCYVAAYSFKSTGPTSGTMPNSGAGMTTSIITPSSYNNNTDITLSAWVKPNSNNLASKTIWGCHADNVSSGISFGMDDAQAGRIKFHPLSYSAVLRSTSSLYANTWYNVTCVYSLTDHVMKIYINGQLNSSQSIPTNPSGTSYELKFLYIWKAGFWSGDGKTGKTTSQSCQQAFPGNILNACTWYRALSDSEISALYNGGAGLVIDTSVAPYDDGLAIAYPMNEASGNIAYSAIQGQDTGLYGYSTSSNQHVQESIFAGQGVVPKALYDSSLDWETNLTVDGSNEFVSTLTLTRGIVPTKFTVTFDNPSPKNPQTLTFYGSTDNYSWTELGTLTVPSNTNQELELNIEGETTEYSFYKVSTTSAYLTTGLTINNIFLNGYWVGRNEVGEHDAWDEEVLEGYHDVIGTSSDYDRIEYENTQYEVANV